MARVLVVEDDATLLELSREALGGSGNVDTTRHTAEALRHITERDYGVLITDLNVEHAGDGLLLAGAMRALQPKARTILITGYPDFTGALAALQSTLDEVALKPVALSTLRAFAQLDGPDRDRKIHRLGKLSVWELMSRERTWILDAWIQSVQADVQLAAIPLTVQERIDHMEGLISELCAGHPGKEHAHAATHGRVRRQQYPSVELISLEIGYLRRVIFELVLHKLLEVDLSRFAHEMFELNLHIDDDLVESLRNFGKPLPKP